MNKARHVQGSQIGIINIADSVSGGVPIGLFNFVKKGYRRFEVYGGEDFEVNLNFKIGVRKFYSLLALGVELDGNERSGFGSEWVLSQRFHLNTDLLSYYVNESSFKNYFDDFFEDQYINNLNKVRVLASVQLDRRLILFGGSTYHVFVSRYQENPEGSLGSNLVENTFFDQTNRKTNVKMWIGFNAGIRF